jgi:SulP family sulfate permease
MRLAGILTGLFVLVEMLLFQDLISFIPKAVFTGLLIKVGYDVMDWNPIFTWIRELKTKPSIRIVAHLDMFFIAGTTLVTVIWNLNAAVIGFTLLFYLIKRVRPQTEDLDSSVSHPFGDPIND